MHIVGGLRNGTGLVGVVGRVMSGSCNIRLPRSTAAPIAASLVRDCAGVELLPDFLLRELLPMLNPTSPDGSVVFSVQSSSVLSHCLSPVLF